MNYGYAEFAKLYFFPKDCLNYILYLLFIYLCMYVWIFNPLFYKMFKKEKKLLTHIKIKNQKGRRIIWFFWYIWSSRCFLKASFCEIWDSFCSYISLDKASEFFWARSWPDNYLSLFYLSFWILFLSI